ncbi:MAG: transaldolase family protein [Pirellulaceae bacterium]|nr:transaldolase family protein [Pirellulaceae bacterium]
MSNPSIASLVASGTNLYLDSIDPELVKLNLVWGAVGATSNPIIIAGLIETGRFDDALAKLIASGKSDADIAWDLTDQLVRDAQQAFLPTWQRTQGDAGWVSFELDPLIEDVELNLPHAERVARYVELGRKWSAGHQNRMIKVPATPAGLDALSALSASGITLNVTLVFTMEQYHTARNNVWEGAQKLANLENFKSVYSIFVSRVDQYSSKHLPNLSPAAQGQLGIVNAKQIWMDNQQFWSKHPTRLKQEIIFASTGTKDPKDPKEKYVAALAGSDIQTNPPETNAAIAAGNFKFDRQVDKLPAAAIVAELNSATNMQHLHETLMTEGLAKFAAPQKQLIATIGRKRQALVGA